MQKEIKMYLEIELYRADLGIKQTRTVIVDSWDSEGNPLVVSIPTDEELLEAHLTEVHQEVA